MLSCNQENVIYRVYTYTADLIKLKDLVLDSSEYFSYRT